MGDQFPHRSHVRAARQIPHLVYAGRALHPPLATPHLREVHDLQCGGTTTRGARAVRHGVSGSRSIRAAS